MSATLVDDDGRGPTTHSHAVDARGASVEGARGGVRGRDLLETRARDDEVEGDI